MRPWILVLLFCSIFAFEERVTVPNSLSNTKCPPAGFDSVKDFDPKSFIRKSWFIQEQAEVGYLLRDTFYCVVATYEPANPENILEGLVVYNYANKDAVNGEPFGTSGSGGSDPFIDGLAAVIPDSEDPSKLLVGPKFVIDVTPESLRSVVLGEYWVVWIHTDESGDYDLAIVSAGAPEFATEDGCQTGDPDTSPYLVNGVGTWLLSRKPHDPEGAKIMKQAAIDLEFDLSNLYPVAQEGCLYAEATLK